MKKRFWLGALFLFCLLLSLVINLPVIHILAKIDLPQDIHIVDLDGTLLDGKIERLMIHGVELKQVTYQANLACLLTLQSCYGLDFDQGQGDVAYDLISQDIELSDFSINYPLSNLAAITEGFLVKPSGELQIDIDSLTVSDSKLGLITGKALWQAAGIVGESIKLGDYEIELVTDNESYRFLLRDKKALLTVDGKGQLTSNGQYTANISIIAQPGLDHQIRTALDFIAKKQGLNNYNIRRTGALPQSITSRLSFPSL